MKEKKLTFTVTLTLEPELEKEAKKLKHSDISVLEMLIERQIQDYNPSIMIERLEVSEEHLKTILKTGFDVNVTAD